MSFFSIGIELEKFGITSLKEHNTSFSEKVSFSHLNPLTISTNLDKMTVSLDKVILWIEDLCFKQFEVKNVLMMDLFITNMQLFASQDVI